MHNFVYGWQSIIIIFLFVVLLDLNYILICDCKYCDWFDCVLTEVDDTMYFGASERDTTVLIIHFVIKLFPNNN